MKASPISTTIVNPFPGIPDETRRGRNIRDGYTRGWGLQFGNLTEQILKDPLYIDASRVADGRTIQSQSNRMNIFLLVTRYIKSLSFGHIVEFGSYRGGSALFMARLCQVLHPGMKVYAFDTFEGMPETDKRVDAHSAGDFANVDLDELRRFAANEGLDNIEFVKGLFEETLPTKLPEIGPIRLNHIDCDILSAVAYSYDATKAAMVSGGYVVLDDPLTSSCLGAYEAVEDVLIRRDGLSAEQVFPHLVFRSH
jgi:predicted O-methyltransferase YrrM